MPVVRVREGHQGPTTKSTARHTRLHTLSAFSLVVCIHAGMCAGGLGQTDIGGCAEEVIGGLAKEFFLRNAKR
jgi:hypothetical protein